MPAIHTTLTGNAEQSTPLDLFERLDNWWRFTLDAFATEDNTLCDTWCTRDEGTWTRVYHRRRKSAADGLTFPWEGWRVFMNPPYSREMLPRAVEKAYSERDRASCIVALLPHDPSTRWWREYIGLHGEHAIVEPLGRRLRFGGSEHVAPFPSAVVIWRPSL